MKWGQVAHIRNDLGMVLALGMVACVLILIGCLALADSSGLDEPAAQSAGQDVVLAEGPAPIEVSAPNDMPASGEAGVWPPSNGPVGIERLARFSH